MLVVHLELVKMKKLFITSIICFVLILGYSITADAQIKKGIDIDGEAVDDFSGISVSMPDANTLAIGAPGNGGNGNDAGHVRIYIWNGMAWTQKGFDIDGEATLDHSGLFVSMTDANNIAIGAHGNDANGSSSGHVRIYYWTGSVWKQKGMDIDGEAANDYSGYSISMPDVNTVAIGAYRNNSNTGHVRIYSWNGSAWMQKGIDIDGEAAGDESGVSVNMPDANTVAIGAHFNEDSGIKAGHVRIYTWNGTAWVQKGIDIDGEGPYDSSGRFVSMPDSNTVAIGAPGNDGNGGASGHVRIYTWNSTAWVQKGNDIEGEAGLDGSGWPVNMPNANTVAIGAPNNDGNGSDAGHARILHGMGPHGNKKG